MVGLLLAKIHTQISFCLICFLFQDPIQDSTSHLVAGFLLAFLGCDSLSLSLFLDGLSSGEIYIICLMEFVPVGI